MRNVHRLILLLLMMFPALVNAAQPNLLLITIDTLRADRLGAYGRKNARTPTLDALAAKAVVFEQAVCQAPLTLPSHTSILTGKYPYHHGTRDNAGRVSESEKTLAEILKGAGYHTYAAVGGFPLDHRFGLNQGFDIYDDRFDREPNKPLDFGSERSAESVVRAVAGMRLASPFFLWVHFYDPHAPYHHGGYEGEISYVDSQVAALLKLLPLQNAIVAVAGDHGESLGEHGEWTHRIFVYDSTMRVPFWFSAPGVKPARIQQQVRLIDFVPTMLSLLQLPAPENLDGVIVPAKAGQPAFIESMFPQLQLGWSALSGIRTAEWKYIEAPRSELYDLRTDKAESRNVFSSHSDIAARMRALLPRVAAPSAAPAVDPETAERLASLGYVSGGSAGKAGGADPKDRIAIWNEIEQAVDLEKSDVNAAIAVLEKARKVDGANPMILSLLAEKYAGTNQLQKAQQALDTILKADARNTLALTRLAHLQLRMGHAAEAKRVTETLIGLSPGSAEAHLVAGQACLAAGETACAATHMKAALRIDPLDSETRTDLGNLYLQKGDTVSALNEFNTVLRSDATNVQALNGLATAAFLANQYKQSELYLQKAYKLRPEDPQTRMNLALVYATTGRKKEAIALYRSVLDSASTPADWKAQAAERLKELQP